MQRRTLLQQLLALGAFALSPSAFAQARALMLAQVYHLGDALDLRDWWISEKYDGIRAYWDGHQLWSRSGKPLPAPSFFTQSLPQEALDGELWAGRGRFEQTSSIVRRQSDAQEDWRQLRYCIFDLPDAPGPFTQRLARLRSLPLQRPAQAVSFFQLQNPAQLRERLDAVLAAGGEGLMLHRGDSAYVGKRSPDLLKLKPHDDAEARVIAHVPGKGRLQGLMGALEVEDDAGRRFRIGSGFSDAQRRAPPAIGSRISYTYNGLTAQGLPRFARFQRLREDLP